MSEMITHTAEQVKKTIGQLKELLAEVDPAAKVTAQGKLNFAELGMTIIYGSGVGSCNGCFGCAGCEGGCMGCNNTATVSNFDPGAEVSNPNPMAVGRR
jgi:hypothetical protein